MALALGVVSCNLSLATGQAVQAQHGEYRYQATSVDTPPIVDGDLSDPVWEKAPVIDQFIQQVPDSGQPATERTEVRIVYDSNSLYIAAYLHYTDPTTVVRNVLRFRDDQVWAKDDIIRFLIDTFHDHRRAYVFTVNALGTKQDAQIDNEAWHSNWDEVWNVRTRLQKDGWSAELQIPFRILRFSSGGEETWGLNIERWIKQKNERAMWAPIPPGVPVTRTANYGHLEGMSATKSERNIQIIPYGLVEVDRARGADSVDADVDAGVDLKWAVTPALALDLTLNTDFAQVEADDRQINLTRFSLFFPEKREFFLENAQLFNFGILREAQIFFSRRIGLERGEVVPILGGARLSGQAGAFDVGLVSIQTDSHLQTPSTNWSASRLRWKIGRRSHLGGIFTSVYSNTQHNRVFGPDALIWLGRNLHLEGFLAVVDDRELSRQPLSYTGAVIYDQDLWEARLRLFDVEEDFNPAMGFVRRRDLHQYEGKLRKGLRLNHVLARKLDFSGELKYLNNQAGILETRQWVLAVQDELDSGDVVRLSLESNFERLDEDFVINPVDGVIIPPGDYSFNRWLLSYQTFQGRAAEATAQLEGGDFFDGERTTLTLSGTWRASPHLWMSGDYEFNDISLPQDAFDTHLWRARVSVPFNARTTVDAFLQWSSLTREFDTQLRFRLIYARDSNLFLVYTSQRQDLAGGLTESDWAIQLKTTFRLYW